MVPRILAVLAILLGFWGVIPPWLTLLMAGGAAAAIALDMVLAVQESKRPQLPTGGDALVGRTAVARTPLSPEGFVFVEGERWLAQVDGSEIIAGERVQIVAAQGLRLKVRRVAGEMGAPAEPGSRRLQESALAESRSAR